MSHELPSRNAHRPMTCDAWLAPAALVIGAMATGRTRIDGLQETEDLRTTAAALSALGAPVTKSGHAWEVLGRGAGGLSQPQGPIEVGGSIAAACLVSGAVAGQPITVTLAGKDIQSDPHFREVLKALARMGLEFLDGSDAHAVTLCGSRTLVPIACELPGADAMLAWPILLAALSSPGVTTVVTQGQSDLVRQALSLFGANVRGDQRGDAWANSVTGEVELTGADLVAADRGRSMLIAPLAAT